MSQAYEIIEHRYDVVDVKRRPIPVLPRQFYPRNGFIENPEEGDAP